jgi:hypothetical protein
MAIVLAMFHNIKTFLSLAIHEADDDGKYCSLARDYNGKHKLQHAGLQKSTGKTIGLSADRSPLKFRLQEHSTGLEILRQGTLWLWVYRNGGFSSQG